MRRSFWGIALLLGLLSQSANGFRGLKPVQSHTREHNSTEQHTHSAAHSHQAANHTHADRSSGVALLESGNTTAHSVEQQKSNYSSRGEVLPPLGAASAPTAVSVGSKEEERLKLTEKLYGRIPKDLEPWKDGITLEMVERLYCTDYDRSFRFQIINGEPFIVGEIPGFLEFNRMTKLLILEAISQYQIPDIDIMMSTADECPSRRISFNGDNQACEREAPLLSFDRGSDQHDLCVPYPDHTFGSGGWPLAKIPGWKDAKLIFKQNEKDLEVWEKRNPHLFFRGAPTGSRLEIVDDPIVSGDERFDVRVTGWTGDTRDEDYVSLPAHCNYKYLMHMPGNGYSARLKYLLMCGSPVIFPYGGLEEFWYHLLENDKNIKLIPWQKGHGEPMGQRIADEYNWLEKHPIRAQELANNASDMIHTVLAPDVGPRYLAHIFIEYAKLQSFTPTKHKDAMPFRLSAMGPDAKYNVWSRSCDYCRIKDEEE